MSEDKLLADANAELQTLIRSVDEYIIKHKMTLPIRSFSHINRARIKLVDATEFISATLKEEATNE